MVRASAAPSHREATVASIVNVTLIEGDDTSRTWTLTTDGTALNLASADVTAVIKPSEHVADNAATAYTLTEGSGITIVSASAGTVKLDIPTAVTASPSQWFYKIRITLSGETETAVWGWISIVDA
jgi:hypothetical protein